MMASSTQTKQGSDVPFVEAYDSDEYSIEVGFEDDGRTPYIAIHVIDAETDVYRELRVTGCAIEITQHGSFRQDRWNKPLTDELVASIDAAFVVHTARKHHADIRRALIADQQLNEWTDAQRTNMRRFFTTMLGVPMSFASAPVR